MPTIGSQFAEAENNHAPSAPLPSSRRGAASIWAVPLLLLIVAALQVLLVHTTNLSPWKGGGFGMFSTVDSPDVRVLQAFVTVGGEEFPVRLGGPLVALRDRVKHQPTERSGEELVDRMLATRWMPPGSFSTGFDRRMQPQWPEWPAEHSRSYGVPTSSADGLVADSVRIDVRRMAFDGRSNVLSTQSLLTADGRRAR